LRGIGMSELMQRLQADYREALKARDERKVGTLRMLFARAKNTAIEQRVDEVDETTLLTLLQKEVKQREDSITQFEAGGRADLVQKETAERDILRAYLPAELSDEEIRAVIRRVIADTGAQGKAGMGKVMRPVMTELKGRADGGRINRLVMEELGP
jgi:uncharacterized protein YqeY